MRALSARLDVFAQRGPSGPHNGGGRGERREQAHQNADDDHACEAHVIASAVTHAIIG